MRVLQTIAGLWRSTGGPARSVPALCRELSRLGARVTLVTGAGDLAPDVLRLPAEVSVRLVPLGPPALARASLAFAAACLEESRRADIVHNHGLWLFPNWAAAWSARRAGKPLVISPRGMLAPWALRRGRLRKKVAWALLEGRAFARASFVHATSEPEAEAVRWAGVRRPIAVIPNGVDLEEFPAAVVERARAEARRSPGPPRVLFLSRIHPQKGWDVLLAAWRTGGLGRRAELVLAGTGEPRHVAALEAALRDGAGERARYVGGVQEGERLARLAAADVVVLPSHTESYGMVVAEALAAGTPVITTTATPWRELVEQRCGWWVEPRPGALAAALAEAVSLSSEARDAMGARGRRLVECDHSLAAASRRMLDAYRWAIGEAPAPGCVRTA